MSSKTMFSQAFINSFYNGLSLFGKPVEINTADSTKKDFEALKKDWEYVGISIKEAAKQCTRK